MIIIPNHLPLVEQLLAHNLQATNNASEPVKLRIGLLNLMPLKQETEFHFASILSRHSANLELHLLKLETHISKNTNADYMNLHYSNVMDKIDNIDVLISTGAPIEELPFEDVGYWNELKKYFAIIKHRKMPFIGVCWSAQAAMNVFYNIQKKNIANKAFGVFEQEVIMKDNILNNLKQPIYLPISRYSNSIDEQMNNHPNLKVILNSKGDGIGNFLLRDTARLWYYITGHPEYGANILKNEYKRDIAKGKKNVQAPINYSLESPTCFWQNNAVQLYHNMIDEVIIFKNNY